MSDLSMKTLVPGPVCGEFRMRGGILCETCEGRPYLRVTLDDYGGHIHAYAWTDDLIKQLSLPDYSQVRIWGQVRQFRGKLQIDLTSVVPLARNESRSAVRLISRSICPVPELLTTLVNGNAKVYQFR